VKTTEPITEIAETHTSYYCKYHKSDQESVSDAARDAYAMSHLSAEATVQPYLRSGGVVVPVYSPSAALAVLEPAECDQSAQRDKPVDGSRGEAPSVLYTAEKYVSLQVGKGAIYYRHDHVRAVIESDMAYRLVPLSVTLSDLESLLPSYLKKKLLSVISRATFGPPLLT